MFPPQKKDKKRYIAKVVLLGDGAVGKTALVTRFVKQSFGGMYKATMGLDLSLKELYFDELEATVGLQLWDMGGQLGFKMLRSRFYTGTQGAILVFDLTRPQSLKNLLEWDKELKTHVPQKIPYIILGNKSDLSELKLIPAEEEKTTIEKLKPMKHYRTSAKTGENVEEAFRLLAKVILKKNIDVKKEQKTEKSIEENFPLQPPELHFP